MAATQARPARDERQTDLQGFGVSAAAASAWLASQEPEDTAMDGHEDGQEVDAAPGAPLAVWPENAPLLGLWMRLQTQWHRRPSGALDGLRYPAVDLLLQRLSPEADAAAQRRTWEQLIEMEHTAVEAQHGKPD